MILIIWTFIFHISSRAFYLYRHSTIPTRFGHTSSTRSYIKPVGILSIGLTNKKYSFMHRNHPTEIPSPATSCFCIAFLLYNSDDTKNQRIIINSVYRSICHRHNDCCIKFTNMNKTYLYVGLMTCIEKASEI